MARRRRKRNNSRLIPFAGFVLVAAVVFTAVFAIANTILNVTPPALGQLQYTVTPDAIKPDRCTMTVTNLIASNTATVNGTAANDLILGGPARQTINGRGGDDCILGGGSTGATNSILDGDQNNTEPNPATANDWCLYQAGSRVTIRRTCEYSGAYP
jgi:hypothetical protein